MKVTARGSQRFWLFLILLSASPGGSVVSPNRRHKHIGGAPSATLSQSQLQGDKEIIFEDETCVTPQGHPGACVPIVRCPKLFKALADSSDQPEIVRLLIRSRCGSRATDVCCGFTARAPFISDTVNKPPGFTVSSSKLSPATPTTQTTTTTAAAAVPSTSTTTDLPKRQKPFQHNFSGAECGIRKRRIGETRIVGGEPSRLGEWPWIVALGFHKRRPAQREPIFGCGGSIVTERHVLTAGHCVARDHPYLARLGDLDLTSSKDGASPVEIPVQGAIIHPGFSPADLSNDIAIVFLRDTISFNADIQPICLPFLPDLRANDLINNELTIAGWGSTYFAGPASPVLQHVSIPVISNRECIESYSDVRGAKIGPGNICAGHQNKRESSCEGDSGGPMVHRVNGTFYHIGVVSFGVRCSNLGYPGVFTRTSYYLDWIADNIK